MRDLPPSQAPDALPEARIQAVRQAEYAGHGKLNARIYALLSPEVALDVAQRWRPIPDSVFFYSGRFFVVVTWDNAEKTAVQSFVRELQKQCASR